MHPAINRPATKIREDEQIAAFVRRVYCKPRKAASGEKRRQLKVEQTREPQGAPLLPGPDEAAWKRFVMGAAAAGVGFS
jgi:hypothetical protein